MDARRGGRRSGGASVAGAAYQPLTGRSPGDALACPAIPAFSGRSPELARAKNTSRAEARRRTRETMRAEDADFESADEEAVEEPVAAPERSRMFKLPNFREDIRALPDVFRSRRLIWLPGVLLLSGLLVLLILPSFPASIAWLGSLYIEFFFIPPALFTFFVAGFLAPRASYLVGFVYGLFAAVLWSIALVGFAGVLTPGGTTDGSPTTGVTDPVLSVANLLVIGMLYGTLAGGFAAWYRDFLRGMRERGNQSRLDREAKERAKRRDERQESRRIAKGRPSS